MSEMIRLGDVVISVTRKDIKNVHLSVHPPLGRVTLVAPANTRLEVARAYAISKLGWIKARRAAFVSQARELPRRFVSRETHYLWGRRYLLDVEHRDGKPHVRLDHQRITLVVRPGSTEADRARVMHEWHKSLLHARLPSMIAGWESRLDVRVNGYFLQRMKTKWGSCNPRLGNIRLNTELVKKPVDLIDYVIVHEMLHLLEPTHSNRFMGLLEQHYSRWREARLELNELPIGALRNAD
jgi:predicted metal-dependent hydrolase